MAGDLSDGLNERKLKILQAIVDDYITTGIPVGSRTISRKYLDLSSATIRNEMMDLEELGYLAQPYTSAGRIPSERAYRLYVERLMKVSELRGEEIDRLQSHVNDRSHDLRQLLRDAAQAISDATTYTAFVLPPSPKSIVVKGIQLVPIAQGLALMVLVTDVGIFKDTFVRISPEFSQEDLYKISVMLQRSLTGCSLKEVTEQLENGIQDSVEDQRDVLDAVLSSITEQIGSEQDEDIMLGGPMNMLRHPEYASIEKARIFLSAIESKKSLLPALRKMRGMEFTVSIGSENMPEVMQDCSIVTVSYNVGDEPMGSLGVIGPTRMDYSHVTSVLNYMQGILSELVEGKLESLRGETSETAAADRAGPNEKSRK